MQFASVLHGDTGPSLVPRRTDAAGRPAYPMDAVEAFLDRLGLPQGAHVVEVGAGPGTFTRQLVTVRPDVRVTAVEPAGMGESLLRLQRVTWVKEAAGSMPAVPSGSADAVVCAQSFHWFAHEHVLGEFQRVLGTSGQLGLIWSTTPVTEEFVGPYYPPSVPRQQSGQWKEAFARGPFHPLRHDQHLWQHVSTKQQVLDRVMSVSVLARLQGTAHTAAEQQAHAWLQGHVDLVLRCLAEGQAVGVPQLGQGWHTAPGSIAALKSEEHGEVVAGEDSVRFILPYATDMFTTSLLEGEQVAR